MSDHSIFFEKIQNTTEMYLFLSLVTAIKYSKRGAIPNHADTFFVEYIQNDWYPNYDDNEDDYYNDNYDHYSQNYYYEDYIEQEERYDINYYGSYEDDNSEYAIYSDYEVEGNAPRKSVKITSKKPSSTVRKSTPVVKKSTPVVKKSTPVVRKSTPTVRKSTPVVKKSTPTVRKSTPTVRKSTPVVKKPITISREPKSLSVKKPTSTYKKPASAPASAKYTRTGSASLTAGWRSGRTAVTPGVKAKGSITRRTSSSTIKASGDIMAGAGGLSASGKVSSAQHRGRTTTTQSLHGKVGEGKASVTGTVGVSHYSRGARTHAALTGKADSKGDASLSGKASATQYRKGGWTTHQAVKASVGTKSGASAEAKASVSKRTAHGSHKVTVHGSASTKDGAEAGIRYDGTHRSKRASHKYDVYWKVSTLDGAVVGGDYQGRYTSKKGTKSMVDVGASYSSVYGASYHAAGEFKKKDGTYGGGHIHKKIDHTGLDVGAGVKGGTKDVGGSVDVGAKVGPSGASAEVKGDFKTPVGKVESSTKASADEKGLSFQTETKVGEHGVEFKASTEKGVSFKINEEEI